MFTPTRKLDLFLEIGDPWVDASQDFFTKSGVHFKTQKKFGNP